MHVQFAACQFITLPRWHGAVKPIFWGDRCLRRHQLIVVYRIETLAAIRHKWNRRVGVGLRTLQLSLYSM